MDLVVGIDRWGWLGVNESSLSDSGNGHDRTSNQMRCSDRLHLVH